MSTDETDATNAIDVSDVSVTYGDVAALDGITVSVEDGAFVGMVGPNGSGKTTLVRAITGLADPDGGTVTVYGKDPVEARADNDIGYVPQTYERSSQFPATVRELLAAADTVEEDRYDIDVVDVLDLDDVLDQQFIGLSGGQQQRVMVALALLKQPRLLILDEPTVGVDMQTQSRFYEFLKELNEEYGVTMLLVSHDVGMVSEYAEEVICLNRAVCCHGTVEQLPEFLEDVYGEGFNVFTHEDHHHA